MGSKKTKYSYVYKYKYTLNNGGQRSIMIQIDKSEIDSSFNAVNNTMAFDNENNIESTEQDDF